LAKRSGRDAAGVAVVEGRPAIEYALRLGVLRTLVVDEEKVAGFADLVKQAHNQHVDTRSVTSRCFRSIADTPTPQGVMGTATCTYVGNLADARLAVVLAGVQDPGNVGAIIRTADAFGATVILGPGTADPRSEKVVRASAGSVLGVPLVRVSDVAIALAETRNAGTRVLAADTGGDSAFFQQKSSADTAIWWVLGNEAQGLPAEILACCDDVVSIQMMGNTESLNVAATAAVCLHWTRNELGYPN
jgi:TrmH family RNA methyltransferase